MKAQPWRLRRTPAERHSDDATGREQAVATSRHPERTDSETIGVHTGITARLTTAEPIIAVFCALVLLLAPNPAIWPAAIIGIVPSMARLVTSGRPWRPTPFDIPLLLLAAGALLGGWAGLSRDGTLIRLTGLLAGFLLFAAAREHARRSASLRRLVPGLLVAAVLSSLLLLVLVAPFLLLDHVPLVPTFVAAVDRWQAGAWFVDQDWLLQRYRFRASGVGALGVMGLALVFAVMVGARSRLGQGLALLTVPLFLILLIVADNRGAMLAGALTLGAMATVWRRRLLPLIPVAGLLTVLFLAFGPVDRGLSLNTLAQRFWFWENSLYLAREVPFTGAGLGLESVQLVYRAYFLPSYPPFSHAHNIYLQGLLEYGVLGLLGLVGIGLATLYLGWRAPTTTDRWVMAGRLTGFGIGMTFLTTGLSEIVMLSTIGSALALAAFGLMGATSPVPRDANTGRFRLALLRPVRINRMARWGVAAGLMALVAGVLVLTPLGPRAVGRLLLNAGTADLNRGSLSETIQKQDREAALSRAARTLELAATFDPNSPAIQRNLALALTGTDESRRGRRAADRAQELTPTTDRTEMFQLGRMFAAQGNWGDAIRSFQAAGAAPQLLQLGNRMIRVRNFEQAINAFVATAQVDPSSRSAYEGVVKAARERKDTAVSVIEALEPLFELNSPTEYGARIQAA
ncbi:MAG: O-antigen ligase family protein, partial [Chloroflexota bacterium]